MDLNALKTFIEVAELGSFTRAGEKLGYSQPTVSFQIKQLEKELGVSLFDRIHHTVMLTDAGKEALRYAQSICHLSQEMVLGTGKIRQATGTVRIGMGDSLCLPLIARNFQQFRQRYPKVEIQIHTAGTAELLRLLDHNEVDLVCTLDSHVYDTGYVIAGEESVGVHFVAAAGHPLAKCAVLRVQELLAEPLLLTEKGMSYRRLMDERLAGYSLEIQPVLETGRADLLCRLVAENMGLSFLPDYVTEDAVRAGEVVRLPVEEFDITVWMQLLYRREKWLSQPMQAMINHLSCIRLSESDISKMEEQEWI